MFKPKRLNGQLLTPLDILWIFNDDGWKITNSLEMNATNLVEVYQAFRNELIWTVDRVELLYNG